MSNAIIIDSKTISKLRADGWRETRNHLSGTLERLKSAIEALDTYISVVEGRLDAGATEAARNAEGIVMDAIDEAALPAIVLLNDLRAAHARIKAGLPRTQACNGTIRVMPKGWK